MASNLFTVVALFANFFTQKDQFVFFAKDQRPQLLTHAILGDHCPGHLGGLFQIAAGAGGNFIKDKLFSGASAHHSRHVGFKFALIVQHFIIAQMEHIAAGHAARNNADFLNRFTLRNHSPDQGVTGLMMGNNPSFFLRDDPAFAFRAKDGFFNGLLEFLHPDLFFVTAGGEDSGLIDQILDISPYKAGSLFGNNG